jgi:RNA polymerase sigma-70 factor (ECF subfamily)
VAAEVEERSIRVEKIVRDHVDSVWRTARDLGVPARDLEDVVQEVFVVVVRRLADIEENRERAFVLATTARIAANWRRKRRRRPEELTESMDSVRNLESLPIQRDSLTPEQALERRQKLAVLANALAEMPEQQREAFTLFELEQLTAREISEQLGVPEAAIFSRVRRAWVVFRRHCERIAGKCRSDEPALEQDHG